MENRPVFFDPGGRRRTVFPRIAAFLGIFLAVVGVAFYLTLLAVPSLRAQNQEHHAGILPKAPPAKPLSKEFQDARKKLFDTIAKNRRPDKPMVSPSSVVVAAFYDPSIETGVNSLRNFGSNITHVIPAWLHLTEDGMHLDQSDFDFGTNPNNDAVIRAARKAGVRIMPLLSNSVAGAFDPAVVHKLLDSPAAQKALAVELRQWLKQYDFQGLNLDFEDLADDDQLKIPAFLRILASEFKPNSLELTTDIESSATTDPDTLKELSAPCDWVLLMDYDQHWETSGPGPIASLDWSEQVLDRGLDGIPSEKLVLGIGNYAYDWAEGKNAEALTYQEALTTASGYRENELPKDVLDFDTESLNSHFDYEDDNGVKHSVWMLDAASAFNQWLGARTRSIRGAGVWALGEEDPGIWTFLNRNSVNADLDPQRMKAVSFPYSVDQMGQGEVLRVLRRPTDGERNFELDKESGIITDMDYVSYPFPFVIQHSGYVPKALALTFDDGPDARYTPEILDELKRLGVKATFFDIGQNVESNAGLVRRTYEEGHEVGNHSFTHPDLSAVGKGRAQLEINATLRAIQSVTGHSSILFRPPYNADSEPSSPNEVEPVDMADKMGYITIGEKVDPQDWNLDVPLQDGTSRAKTAQDIATDVLNSIRDFAAKKQEGNIILLHDAGGPRDATVAALKLFVPQLQKEGYKFVLVSDLMGKPRDGVMPPVPAKDRFAIWFDGLVFSSVFAGEALLAMAFITAIGLGLLRIFFVLPLALRHRQMQASAVYDPAFAPKISALVAAFNEEKVISRTIACLLDSDYPVEEVIVVDDGSTDATFDTVAADYAGNPRVRIVRQDNGGKSSALNHALTLCETEFVVCIDADTQLHKEAIGKLIRHFHNPKVAAVAGNVRVGNTINVLTKWQALEYTTSQNLDRRAYAALNSITVVPGAIGAWRRSAVLEVDGYQPDTLAEDMDVTWRLRRAGYRMENEAMALAFTEAPDTFRGFFRQRFRWAYGTLQCLVKHRRALFHYGWFGSVALPTMWLFQVIFQAIAPLVDVQVLYSLTGWVAALQSTHAAVNAGTSAESSQMALQGATTSLIQVLILYGLFFAVELIAGFVSYWLEGEPPKPLVWLFLQRFAYRQVMYGVIYKSIGRALAGGREGWGKIERKGTVGGEKKSP